MQEEDFEGYKDKVKATQDKYTVNAAPNMFLAHESIDTLTDMATRLSVREDVLRAYLGIETDDREQHYICALQSSSNDFPHGTSQGTKRALSHETASTGHHEDDESAFIQKLEAVSEWFQMDDVNYIPPPNIASRKKNTLHRDRLFAVGEISLPW